MKSWKLFHHDTTGTISQCKLESMTYVYMKRLAWAQLNALLTCTISVKFDWLYSCAAVQSQISQTTNTDQTSEEKSHYQADTRYLRSKMVLDLFSFFNSDLGKLNKASVTDTAQTTLELAYIRKVTYILLFVLSYFTGFAFIWWHIWT